MNLREKILYILFGIEPKPRRLSEADRRAMAQAMDRARAARAHQEA